jgi:hypothetical protein
MFSIIVVRDSVFEAPKILSKGEYGCEDISEIPNSACCASYQCRGYFSVTA